MKALHIRNVDPATLSALKRLARGHHRSLQGELHGILERAARLAPPEQDDGGLDLVTVASGSDSSWGRDNIYGNEGR
ncbi:MAG: hypothetical protein KAI66_18890 [Lentisphaeria bacterium]|nr:hypothetical protein [Lentisphaeria bacterium]